MVNQREIQTETADRLKYSPLYLHLLLRDGQEWRTTFNEVETILGFELPDPAREYQSWWLNQSNGSHGQALVWQVAGWRVSAIDLESESVVFERTNSKEHSTNTREPSKRNDSDIDEWLPPHDPGPWPEGLVSIREWLYGSDD